jgi:CHAT domain-containing protein
VVHIASHFEFRPGDDTASVLLLGDGTTLPLSKLNNQANLFSGVDLLTLSACNTAMGGGDGKEVDGFAMMAQNKGADAILATLWPVADQSTSLLMKQFYSKHESTSGMSKAEALQQAQLALLRGAPAVAGESRGNTGGSDTSRTNAKAPYAHPYYWAPFVLIGSWK